MTLQSHQSGACEVALEQAESIGLDTVRVRDPQDTLGVIAAVVACQK